MADEDGVGIGLHRHPADTVGGLEEKLGSAADLRDEGGRVIAGLGVLTTLLFLLAITVGIDSMAQKSEKGTNLDHLFFLLFVFAQFHHFLGWYRISATPIIFRISPMPPMR